MKNENNFVSCGYIFMDILLFQNKNKKKMKEGKVCKQIKLFCEIKRFCVFWSEIYLMFYLWTER